MDWWVWLIIAIVAVVVLGLIAGAINRFFIRRYGVSLFVGGFFALIAAACIAGGVFLVKDGSGVGWALVGVGAVILLVLMIIDFKKCGVVTGLFALVLQIVFCVPGILLILDLLFNHGRSTIASRNKASRAYNEYISNNREE